MIVSVPCHSTKTTMKKVLENTTWSQLSKQTPLTVTSNRNIKARRLKAFITNAEKTDN